MRWLILYLAFGGVLMALVIAGSVTYLVKNVTDQNNICTKSSK